MVAAIRIWRQKGQLATIGREREVESACRQSDLEAHWCSHRWRSLAPNQECGHHNSDTQQGRNDLIVGLAQLRHGGNQRSRGGAADSGNAFDDLGEFGKTRRGLDHGRDRGFELDQFDGDRLQDPGVHPLNRGRQRMLALAFQLGLHTLQCLARIHHLVKLLARRIVGLAASFVEGLGEPGNHLGIDRVILGEPSGRLSEAANSLRIDDPNLYFSAT